MADFRGADFPLVGRPSQAYGFDRILARSKLFVTGRNAALTDYVLDI